MAKRASYTVYCETCQKQFATYVLGRGFVQMGPKAAKERAVEHVADMPGHVVNVTFKSDHVVTVKEKA